MARFETGEHILEFWFNGWLEGFYHDESGVEIEDDDGGIVLDKEHTYDLYDFGVITSHDEGISFPFVDAFNEWLSQHDEFVCPKCDDRLGFVCSDELLSGSFTVISGVIKCRNCGYLCEWPPCR